MITRTDTQQKYIFHSRRGDINAVKLIHSQNTPVFRLSHEPETPVYEVKNLKTNETTTMKLDNKNNDARSHEILWAAMEQAHNMKTLAEEQTARCERIIDMCKQVQAMLVPDEVLSPLPSDTLPSEDKETST